MWSTWRRLSTVGCLLASLCVAALAAEKPGRIILPNPKLIHCRAAECSQLWRDATGDGEAVYPAQVFTDVVNGEIVGLTAVYDKSVPATDIGTAFDMLFRNWRLAHVNDAKDTKMWLWRVESEQLAIALFHREDGTKLVTYLKFGTTESHIPSAHIEQAKDCK
jgi:hypothetical protein